MRTFLRPLTLIPLLILTAGLPGCFEFTGTGTGCYWMENTSGEYRWERTAWDYESCFELDSCDGGLGASGGGCYKWADSPDGERYPWPDQGEYAAPKDTADTADDDSGGQ